LIKIPEGNIIIDEVKYNCDQITFEDLKKLIYEHGPNICIEDKVNKLKLYRVMDLSKGNEIWDSLKKILKVKFPMDKIIKELNCKIFPQMKNSSHLISNSIILMRSPLPTTTCKYFPMVYLILILYWFTKFRSSFLYRP
jgi:hypothetical protein